MTKTIIHDKQMLFLVLVVAFFVGASITGVFFDFDAEAKKTQFTTPQVGGEILILAVTIVAGSIMTEIYQCVDAVVPGEIQS